jgi:uncharacterized membrane protein YccC
VAVDTPTPQPRDRLSGEEGSPTIRVNAAEPRIFGMVPPAVALAVGFVCVAAGVVLIFSPEQRPAGIVALCLGAVLLVLTVDAARRWPTSAVARVFVRSVDGAGSRLGLARVFAGAWSQATREEIRLRNEIRALQQERDHEQFELGAAAYEEDADRVAAGRERMAELDGQIEEDEREIEAVIEGARRRVDRERAAIDETRPYAVPETRRGGAPATEPHPRRRSPA